MSTDHIAGIFIPARLESTRLPRKMLLDVCGKTLIVRTCERVATLGMPYAVATDSDEISDAVRDSGHECILTCQARNGTERIARVASNRRERLASLGDYSGMDCWYVIVQGDEPEIDVDILRNFVDRLRNIQDGAATISTTADPGDTHRRSVVKVVTNIDGLALWFSRDLPIGHRHVGVYAYRERVLLDYLACEPCQAEVEFSLEQLRTLHLGHAMRVVHYPGMRCRGVDTVEDYEALVERFK